MSFLVVVTLSFIAVTGLEAGIDVFVKLVNMGADV